MTASDPNGPRGAWLCSSHPYAARRGSGDAGRDGKAGSLIELESRIWLPLT